MEGDQVWPYSGLEEWHRKFEELPLLCCPSGHSSGRPRLSEHRPGSSLDLSERPPPGEGGVMVIYVRLIQGFQVLHLLAFRPARLQ